MNCTISNTSIVSGRATFLVSGRKRVRIPASRDVHPNMRTGATGLTAAWGWLLGYCYLLSFCYSQVLLDSTVL